MVKFLIFLALLSGCFSPLKPVTVNTTACQIKFELRSTKYWKASELAPKLAASSQDEILAAGQSIFEVFMKYLEFEKHKDIFSRADLYPRPFSESEKSKVKKTYASEPAKIFLAQAICEWERKHEREARHRIQLLARSILRKKRLEEYEGVIERELRSYVSLRQLFYETVASVERNSAIPFLGLARIARSAGDWQQCLRLLADGLRTKDRDSVVLGEIVSIVQEQELKEMEVQCERFRAGQLRLDDFCLLLSSQQRKASLESNSDSGQLELGQMIQTLVAELGSEPLPAWDKVGPLLAEFRRRADPVIGNHTKSRIDLALAFFEMRLMSAAKDELQQIPEEDPNFGQTLCLLGQIHFEEGALLAAMECYQKCLRDERFKGLIHDEAEYQLIRIYVKLEDFGKAMIHLRDLESGGLLHSLLSPVLNHVESLYSVFMVASEKCNGF